MSTKNTKGKGGAAAPAESRDLAPADSGAGLPAVTEMDPNKYMPTVIDPSAVREVIAANVGDSITPFDLDRIKVPSGESVPMFAIPSVTGDDEAAKELVGIIVGFRDGRGYWKESIDEGGGGQPPDCSSQDGKIGIGTRFWNDAGDPVDEKGKPSDATGPWACATCPHAQFGTAKDGEGDGQACRATRLIFTLRKGEMLPLVVVAPPTSLKDARKFMLRMASRAVPFYAVEVKLTLAKQKNAGGIDYYKIAFGVARALTMEERSRMKQYVDALTPMVKEVQIKPTDVAP